MTTHIATAVYFLCLLASAGCAALLVRAYRSVRTPVLLWTAICFTLLAVSNLLLVIDLVLLPVTVDLRPLRLSATLLAVATLLYGFIWELD